MKERNIAIRRALLKALIAIGVIVAISTAVISVRESIFPPRALMLVLLMIGGNNTMFELASRHTDTQVLVTFITFVRIVILALAAATVMDFILRQRLPMLYTRRSKRMQDHVIVCGLGHVGYRVVVELERFDTEMTVIEIDAEGQFVASVNERGIPILFEDARKSDVLRKAGLERAVAVIACTDDDLTNVEIALDAREIRPDIRVVLRFFDHGLASKIVNNFDIEAAFSASALAAPAFAAAAVDPSVQDSFYVGDVLFVHSAFVVPDDSTLTHETVWDIWGKYNVNTLGFVDANGTMDRHPGPAVHIPVKAKVTVVGPYEQIQRLQADHGIIEPSDRVRHKHDRDGRKKGFGPTPPIIDPGR
ncbi:MAG: NAD(P)-binding protein [Actinomycetota bacterium]